MLVKHRNVNHPQATPELSKTEKEAIFCREFDDQNPVALHLIAWWLLGLHFDLSDVPLENDPERGIKILCRKWREDTNPFTA